MKQESEKTDNSQGNQEKIIENVQNQAQICNCSNINGNYLDNTTLKSQSYQKKSKHVDPKQTQGSLKYNLNKDCSQNNTDQEQSSIKNESGEKQKRECLEKCTQSIIDIKEVHSNDLNYQEKHANECKQELPNQIINFFKENQYQLGNFIAAGGFGVRNMYLKNKVLKEKKPQNYINIFMKQFNLSKIKSFYCHMLTKLDQYYHKINMIIIKMSNFLTKYLFIIGSGIKVENQKEVDKISRKEDSEYILIYNSIADYYNEQSQFGKARAQLVKSLDLCNELFKKEHLYTASTLNKLGLFNLYEVGLDYSLQLIQMIVKIIKGDSDYKAIYLNTLSWCFSKLQNNYQALEMQQESLKVRENIFTEYHTRIAIVLLNDSKLEI
ncbi:hypothetical protein ABPG72_017526 [Tetrahymena utriculariae]